MKNQHRLRSPPTFQTRRETSKHTHSYQGEEFIRFEFIVLNLSKKLKRLLMFYFHLYYGVVNECSSTRFLQLAKTFDQKVFSKIPHKCTEVINLAPSMAEQMENAVAGNRNTSEMCDHFDCCVRFRTYRAHFHREWTRFWRSPASFTLVSC